MSSKHSSRKSQAKQGRKQSEPTLPVKPKVYWVDPMNFRSLVQTLTGPQSESAPPALQDYRYQPAAPSPVEIPAASTMAYDANGFPQTYGNYPEYFYQQDEGFQNVDMGYNSMDANDWRYYPFPSPGTLSGIDQFMNSMH